MDIIDKFSPYIYFHPKETCFPIKIEKYLSICQIKSKNDPYFSIQDPTCKDMYDLYEKGKTDLFLSFYDFDSKIAGDRKETDCYCRNIKTGENSNLLIYFYLFSHTEPYKCCDCGCAFNQWAHLGDIKFIAVEVINGEMNRVYYGAHGYSDGEWRKANEIRSISGHPVAYSCLGDHSFYPDIGKHPRIFCCVCDDCDSDSVYSTPTVNPVYAKDQLGFNPDLMGWIYFPGNMNTQGIASPFQQSFWHGDIPKYSNNWFLRLFCCKFF